MRRFAKNNRGTIPVKMNTMIVNQATASPGTDESRACESQLAALPNSVGPTGLREISASLPQQEISRKRAR